MLTTRRRGVLIVSGTPVIRMGLAAMVSGQTGGQTTYPAGPGETRLLVVQDAVGSAAEAARILASARPALSVLVVDPPLPDASAGEALQRLAAEHPTTATLVLLQQPDPSTVRRACRLGARGVHDIAISDDTLRAALMRMDGGDVAMQPNLVRYLLEPDLPDGDGEANGSGASVPARELTVLQLLARGYTSKQIAPLLGTTSKAVDLLAERAARRLSAANRTEAVATALRRGLLT